MAIAKHSRTFAFFLSLFFLLLASTLGHAQCTGTGPFTCTETQTVSIPAGPNGTGFGTWVPATVYPSELTISGLSGTIATISVQLHGLTSNGQGSGQGTEDLGVLLEGPNGSYVELMGQAGNGGNGEDWTGSGVLLNIQDGEIRMPDAPCPNSSQTAGWPNPDVSNGSSEGGPFEPTSCPFSNTFDTYPSPGPGTLTSGEVAEPTGTATLNGAFDSISPNGTWKLYLVNDEGQFSIDDAQSISGWSLIFTLNSASSSTTTTLSSNINPSFTSGTGSAVTLTATVTSSGGTPTGTVAFKDGANTIAGCGAQTLSGGQTTCNTTFTTQGNHALTADYSGGGGFVAGNSQTLNQFVETPTTGSFCNAGGITMPGVDNTSPYPSVINVTGISNAVATVSLTLNGFSWNESADAVHLLLVSPNNQALEFFSASTDATTGTYTFIDTGTQAPQETAISPGTYQPTVYTIGDVFTPQPPLPAPQVPSSFNVAEPAGGPSAGTFESSFNGSPSNGAWSLFVYDDAGTNASGSITGGWCLDITQASGAATTTSVTSTPNPALAGVSVIVTATVKSGGNPVTSGSVTFTENGQDVAGGPTSPVSVNGSGQATFSTTSLPEGDHNILATYNGVPSTYALSFGNKVQRVDNASTSSINSGVYSYCNPGTITIPSTSNSTDEGQASPNPSNIFVANAPGTIKHVTVTLNGVQLSTPYFLTSLLVGPLNTTADSLDFFSDVGGATPMTSPVNVTLNDDASSLLGIGASGSPLESGTFKPTSAKGSDTFFASSDGFYTPPASPYNYAAPISSFTFDGTYESQNPNGTWSLYLNQDNQSPNSSMSSWCVNLTENPPVLAITKSHTGDFTQGQTGAQYSVVVSNDGPGSTGGSVTVTDNPPTGLTVTGMSGNNWSCSTSSCTRSDALAQGNSYDTITVTVNVSSNAASSVTNQAVVSGGGSAGTQTATDSTTILPAIASISAVKSVTSTGPYNAVGQVISYQFVATNTGNLTLTSLGIADTQTAPAGALTSGPTCVSLSSPTGACSGSTTTLAPGQSATFTATYTITQADLDSGSVNDSATASGTPPTGPPVTSTPSTAAATINSAPALTVKKSVTSTGPYNSVGQVISYAFVANNTGNVTLHAVGVSDTQTAPAGALASGPTCVSLSSPTGACSGSTTTLVPGQSATFTATYTITQADLDNGSVNDSATASGTPPTGSPDTSMPSTATVNTVQSPGISLAKSANPTTYSTVGATINYSYHITNTGNTTLSGAFTVADNRTTVTCPATPPSGLAPGGILTCTATYTITQADIDAGSVTNLATAKNASVTSPQASATVTAIQTLGISLVKSANPTTYSSVGATINYSYPITNTGNTTLSGPFTVTDNKTTVTCPVTSGLAPGASLTCTATYTITQADMNAGSVTNLAIAKNASVTSPQAAATVTAIQTTYLLTTAANPSNGGTVTPTSGSYNSGAVVPLTASPASGYAFVNWTSSPGSVANSTSPSTTITMNAAESVTANFAVALPYTPSLNFGTVYLNSKHKLTGTITNNSASNVTFTSATITQGTADAGAYKPFLYCTGTPLKPGKSCTFAVDLTADAVGTLTATLNIFDSAGTQEVSLTASVIDPIAQFNLKTLAFGSVLVNGSRTLPVQLTNIGETDLDINNVTITGAKSGEFSPSNLCPASLTPTSSCTIEVTFSPTAKGAVGGTLVVTDNVTGGKSSIPITGTGH